MTAGVYTPEQTPDDMSALLTSNRTNLVGAINEVVGNVAKCPKYVRTTIGLTGPVAIPALPTGTIIIGVQVHVGVAYPTSTVFNIGDHSGSQGALAATSISSGTGITATATGDYAPNFYYTPSGDLSITVTGGNGSTGSATVLVKYIDN